MSLERVEGNINFLHHPSDEDVVDFLYLLAALPVVLMWLLILI